MVKKGTKRKENPMLNASVKGRLKDRVTENNQYTTRDVICRTYLPPMRERLLIAMVQ